MHFTDQELIEGIAEGDRQTIQRIYNNIQPMILKWMISRGANETAAEDIFQEGMLVLYHQCGKKDFKLTSKLSTYLLAICKRIWFKQLSNEPLTDLGDDFLKEEWQDLEEDFKYKEAQEQQFKKLEAGLELLGSPCKELLEAFYLEGKNMQELALEFNYTNANTAKTQRYKCMNRLRKLMNSSI